MGCIIKAFQLFEAWQSIYTLYFVAELTGIMWAFGIFYILSISIPNIRAIAWGTLFGQLHSLPRRYGNSCIPAFACYRHKTNSIERACFFQKIYRGQAHAAPQGMVWWKQKALQCITAFGGSGTSKIGIEFSPALSWPTGAETCLIYWKPSANTWRR